MQGQPRAMSDVPPPGTAGSRKRKMSFGTPIKANYRAWLTFNGTYNDINLFAAGHDARCSPACSLRISRA